MPWGMYLLTNNLFFDRIYLGFMKKLGMIQMISYNLITQ